MGCRLEIVGRSRLTGSVQRPQQQCQIARCGLYQQSLVDILPASAIQPIHAAGIEMMREVSLDPLAALRL
jgi:hypothetical protein